MSRESRRRALKQDDPFFRLCREPTLPDLPIQMPLNSKTKI
jgi:hypothetical protein